MCASLRIPPVATQSATNDTRCATLRDWHKCDNLPDMTPTNLLTTEQVAARAGKHVSTINRWAQNGRITPAIQLPGVTGDRLYDPEDEDVAALIQGDSNDQANT